MKYIPAFLVALLVGCSSHSSMCDAMTCRPQSDNHHVVIWWSSDMREGDQSFSKMPVR